MFRLRSASTASFMCGSYTLPCPECHPSCSSCDIISGICDSCLAGADAEPFAGGAACRCKDGKAPRTSISQYYHQVCVDCVSPCATCFGDAVDNCYTCKVSTAVIKADRKGYGHCICGNGFQPVDNPTEESSCVSCVPSGCPYCTGPTEDDCYASIEANSLSQTGFFAISYTTTTICYDQPLGSVSSCGRSFLEDIMGPLTDDGAGVYTPTKTQCNKLLLSIWPATEFWFAEIFPTLDPITTVLNRYIYKSSFMKLILQFSPAALLNDSKWTDIVAAWNAPAPNWENYFFWGGANPGYTINGGVTALEFPPAYKAWVLLKCPTENCIEFVFFNLMSTVCSNPSCALTAVCAVMMPGSSCST